MQADKGDQVVEVASAIIIEGQEYTVIEHVKMQTTNIKVTRAGESDSGDYRSLLLSGPILLLKEAKLAGMMKPAAVLLMKPEDFYRIEQAVHAGAFGSDYHKVNTSRGTLMSLWKLAADLNGIVGYEAVPVPVDVGTYPLCDDLRLNDSKFTPEAKKLMGCATTKLRYDLQNHGKVTSVHHLELADGRKLACISTDKFYEDFYKINKNADEQTKVKTMFEKLAERKILAALSNSTQHQIVFLEYDGAVLEAAKFADMLKKDDELCQIIRRGLANKGYNGAPYDDEANDKRFEAWVADYIRTFGSGP
eukprot:TRINITY_DN11348_c0_g1_i2.p1 TRINITY_DN11348_c0_g1~~TRINITY_DN11348_c0_g1_i2.p1  ORF type:complete len:306 (+),score=79.60 TRINITY_DN11348_c0_g1_i2:227-1144(+)